MRVKSSWAQPALRGRAAAGAREGRRAQPGGRPADRPAGAEHTRTDSGSASESPQIRVRARTRLSCAGRPHPALKFANSNFKHAKPLRRLDCPPRRRTDRHPRPRRTARRIRRESPTAAPVLLRGYIYIYIAAPPGCRHSGRPARRDKTAVRCSVVVS